MLAQFYAPIFGGEERMVESLAVGLMERGHDVAVATLRQPGQAAREEIRGVRIHRLPGMAQRLPWLFSEDGRRFAPPAPDPETVGHLRRVLDTERPDVVHGHNWLAHAYLPLRRRRPSAFVESLHDYSLVCANKRLVRGDEPCSGPGPGKCVACAARQYGVLTGPPVALLTRAGCHAQRRAVDRFLPVSEEVAARCGLARMGVPFEVVPNFLLDGPEAAAHEDPALDGLPDGEFLLYVGDLTNDKGVGALLEAHAAMHGRPPLVLIGRTVDPALSRAREDVTVLGPVAHAAVLAAWQRCTVAVVPSITPETFGLVALEAMAAGRPVVAARAGGLPEVVSDRESGLLVAPGDPQALRAALEAVMGDHALRERLSAGAIARAAAFTPQAVLPRFEQAYERARTARSQAIAA